VPSAVIRRRSGAAALTLLVLAALCATTAFGASKPAAEPPVDPARFQALEFRQLGPFRGGRVTA